MKITEEHMAEIILKSIIVVDFCRDNSISESTRYVLVRMYGGFRGLYLAIVHNPQSVLLSTRSIKKGEIQ